MNYVGRYSPNPNTPYGGSKTKEYRRAYTLKRNWNMTLEEFQALANKQSNLCAICGKPPLTKAGNPCNLHIDHNHKRQRGETGYLRELLCSRCNTLLGQSEESVDLLEKVIGYITKHNK